MGYATEHGIKAICFDIDGTFYPKWKMDLRLIRASVFHLPFAMKYNKLRKLIRAEDGYSSPAKMNYEDISKRASMFFYGDDSDLSQKKFREKEKKVFHDFYLRSYANIKPAKWVRESLEKAKANGYRMAALSDFPIGVKLQAMGIDEFFDFSLSSEDLGHFKPSRTPFDVLSERLGVPENDILYVGDSYRKDVLGARNAGMHTCLIFNNEHEKHKEADLCLPSWKVFLDRAL